jgi:UDP-N-acetylglucosamine enolpyruvyl transferase
LMAAALLAPGESRLANVPRLRDVTAMLELLTALGARRGLQGRPISPRPRGVAPMSPSVAPPGPAAS